MKTFVRKYVQFNGYVTSVRKQTVFSVCDMLSFCPKCDTSDHSHVNTYWEASVVLIMLIDTQKATLLLPDQEGR